MSGRSAQEILKILDDIIRNVKDVGRAITANDDIRQLGLDSLDTINYLFSVEESFGLAVPVEILEEKELFTIQAMIEYLQATQK